MCRLQPQHTQQGQRAQEEEGKQHRIAVSVLGQCSQCLLCSLLQSLRVTWSFRREGLIWLQWQLCVLGTKALAIIDTSGFVATISALSKRVIDVYRQGLAYRILGRWWPSMLDNIMTKYNTFIPFSALLIVYNVVKVSDNSLSIA